GNEEDTAAANLCGLRSAWATWTISRGLRGRGGESLAFARERKCHEWKIIRDNGRGDARSGRGARLHQRVSRRALPSQRCSPVRGVLPGTARIQTRTAAPPGVCHGGARG